MTTSNKTNIATPNEPSNIWKPEDHIPPELKESFGLLSKSTPANYVINFLHIIEQLKIQKRTGWLDHNINDCESIADHMYRMGVTCMLLKTPGINRDACVRIALVHDMAESLVGDITPHDSIKKAEKHRREFDTIKYITEKLVEPYNKEAAKQIEEDWLAYENISSPEARFVKDIDKFELLVQCFAYEKRYGKTDLQQFWGAVKSIKTDEVKSWAQDLLKQREEFFSKQK
ncbi:probable HD domain-containing protein YGL101W [Saccharomycodes ludwigii]|uniref:5'-deoxynucleotidase n=1 Tax=Saccharomycodes ludwigii TaxID=36035 RepID=A0A376B5P8_9ASCO|nr:hypothetical protein SCDLUD_001034 [Saccharomycodes ludwigii]KAH3903399.1 hypothetical protein SCDLUD_001034 [Saccharomycodes ludwigii]SSD60018.1 probable HD domain-containing protein YGL101W [Saccharomycodes ludwigii]